MFSLLGLFSKKCPIITAGFTDWHSHLLPGVDDGVQQMEESVDMLEIYEKNGVKRVWLTPHIMEDMPNTTAQLKGRFQELLATYSGNIELRLASENMLDNLFKERLENNDFLPIGDDGRTLLVETSYFNAPIKFHDTLLEIKSKGYFPLLAHPERYNYINTMAGYRELKELGVKFQLNALSILGYYGPSVKRKAKDLLAHGMYDRIGSDMHRMEHLNILSKGAISSSDAAKIHQLG